MSIDGQGNADSPSENKSDEAGTIGQENREEVNHGFGEEVNHGFELDQNGINEKETIPLPEAFKEEIILTEVTIESKNDHKEYVPKEEFVLTEMTDVIGEYGPWQKSVLMMCLLTCLPYVWQELNYGFSVFPLDHWCGPPEELAEIINTTERVQRWKSMAIPKDKPDDAASSLSKCFAYQHSFSSISEWSRYLTEDNYEPTFLSETQMISCKSWEFNHTFYGETLTEKFNLVCRKSDQLYLGRLIYTIGFIVSVLIFGSLGDKVGRRPVMLICLSLLQISSFFIAFSASYVFYVVMRFAIAMGAAGLFAASFVMVMEVSGPIQRPFLGMMMALACSVAFLVLPGLAWLANNWFWLQLITTIPSFISLELWFLMRESPRWLLATGRLEKARKAVEIAGDKNNKSVAQIYINGNALFRHLEKKFKWQIIMSEYGTLERKSLPDLLKNEVLRTRVVIILFCWFVSSLTYNGISVDGDTITGDLFVNFAIVGAVQIVALLVAYLAIVRKGRRIPLSVCMMVACVMCLACIPIPNDLQWLQAIFTVAGNAFIVASSAILFIFTAELFPTVTRSAGIGTSLACAGIGALLAPFIADIASVAGKGIPLGIFGIVSAAGAVLALRLPETNFKRIPDDLNEAENIKKEPIVEKSVQNTSL